MLPPATLSEETHSILQELYLTNNNLTDKCVPLLTGHPHLKILHMAYNRLQSFPARWVTGFTAPAHWWTTWNIFIAKTEAHSDLVGQVVFLMWWHCSGWIHLLCPVAHCYLFALQSVSMFWLHLEYFSAWRQYAFEVGQGGLLFSPAWSLCLQLVGFCSQKTCKRNSLKMSFGTGLSHTGEKILMILKEILPWQWFRWTTVLSVHSVLIRSLSSVRCAVKLMGNNLGKEMPINKGRDIAVLVWGSEQPGFGGRREMNKGVELSRVLESGGRKAGWSEKLEERRKKSRSELMNRGNVSKISFFTSSVMEIGRSTDLIPRLLESDGRRGDRHCCAGLKSAVLFFWNSENHCSYHGF